MCATSASVGSGAAVAAAKLDYEFLPDAAGILEELVPLALKIRLFKMFLFYDITPVFRCKKSCFV